MKKLMPEKMTRRTYYTYELIHDHPNEVYNLSKGQTFAYCERETDRAIVFLSGAGKEIHVPKEKVKRTKYVETTTIEREEDE